MKTLLLASALIVGFSCSAAAVPAPSPAPYHAFCRALWVFATPCAEISSVFAQQIQLSGPQYKLVSATPSSILASHTSLDGVQTEKVTFSFSNTVATASCRVSAQSTSLGYTSLIDNGLNYCNLRYLLAASGLLSDPGFMDLTNEWACLGYGMSTCKAPQALELTPFFQ